MSDDQPESEDMTLVVPFIVCASQGGPYDDDAFVAGFACGDVDRALAVAATIHATHVGPLTCRTILLPQLELIAMARGFPVMDTTAISLNPDGPAEWSYVTFTKGGWPNF